MKHSTATITIMALASAIPVAVLAGIQGSGFHSFVVVAPVTGSSGGTVSVGGVAYSDSGASVEVDGQTGHDSQIKVGDVVTAYGHTGNIERLILNHSVRATVDSVDLVRGTFAAAGQTVHVTAQTSLDGLAALVPGANVQVSGWADSTGDIVASRIELLAPGSPDQVSGQLASLDAGRHRFKINQLTVDFGTAEVEGVLQEGADVRVDGVSFDSTGALIAKEVQRVEPLQVTAGQKGRLEGIVTSMASASQFEIDGQPVRVISTTKQHLHGAVALNAKVKVDGVFDSAGVLVADELK